MAKDKGLAPGVQGRFAPNSFTQTIEQHSLKYRWSRAVICTCQLNAYTGQPDPNCGRCDDGWRYVNPCYRQEKALNRDYSMVSAIFSSVTLDPSSHEYHPSPWVTGQGVMTVDSHIPISYRDRFVAVHQRFTFSQSLLRGPEDLVPVGRLGRTRAEKLRATRYEPVDIHYIEDEDAVIYDRYLDFDVRPGSDTLPARLEWKPARGPAENKRYSISYDARPVWLVDDATFGIQNSFGPAGGLSGTNEVQYLPTTFKVVMDWLSEQRG